MDKFIIGTRGSQLALWQANFIKERLEKELRILCDIKIVKTTGDKILDAPLAKIGGKGLFTKELEELLLKNEITFAVHSLKDVPVNLEQGLELACITKRHDARDCFVSKYYRDIESLPQNARIGTTSLRRAMQIKAIRKDIDAVSLRGNVQTRLEKLRRGEFHAIILAIAALDRLDIDVKFMQPLALDYMIPAMGQGALGIECAKDCQILHELRSLNDRISSIECGFEREFIRLLNGGCQVPIGVHATYKSDNDISFKAIIGLPNGEEIIEDSVSGKISDSLAQQLLQKLEAKGAREVLSKALAMI